MGDDNYLRNITNGSFNVFKIVTGINIIGKDIFVGQNVTFNITLGADITEVIIINVASESDKIGKNYTTFVENGNGTYTVFDLPAPVIARIARCLDKYNICCCKQYYNH